MEVDSPISNSSESLLNKSSQQKVNVFRLQTKLLMWKQYLIFTRNLKSTLFQVFTPVLICIFLVLLQQLANYSMSTMVVRTPDVLTLNSIPKCYGTDCITIGIAYTNSTTTKVSRYVIKYL